MALPNPGMTFTPFDPLPASDLNDMVENIEAIQSGSSSPVTTNVSKNLLTTDSNPYKFRAYRTSSVSFGTSFTKFTFDTESYDTNNNFATGTYTAPVSGFYQFNARCSTSQGSGTHRLVITLRKNGSTDVSRGTDVFAGFFNGSALSDLVQLTAGNTVEIFALADASLAADVTDSSTCYFSGYLVSKT